MATERQQVPREEINLDNLLFQVLIDATVEATPAPTPAEVDAAIPPKDWAWATGFADPDERALALADLVYAAEQRLRQERHAARGPAPHD